MNHRKLLKYWHGKNVLITGASSGIGAALVMELAQYQIHFCLLSRRVEPMNELSKRLSETGSRFWIRKCDVIDRADVETAIDEFVKESGTLDVAWVNSGIGGDTSFGNWNWNLVEEMIDTNFKGAIYTAQACLRHMVPQKQGAIVAVSSSAAMRGLGARSIYSSTKIALAYYMDSMAAELKDIQFTTIYPGFVDTPINENSPNRFWILQPETAARLMIRAVAKGKSHYIFPFRMKLLFHAIRSLPNPIYRALARRKLELTRPLRAGKK